MKTPIDKIPVEMFKTIHKKDANGNRIKSQEKYIGYKKLRLVGGWQRFAHAFIDILCFQIIYQSFIYLIELWSLSSSSAATILTIGFLGSIVGLLIYPLFYFLFENKFQRTPGKWVTQTLVVDLYGEKPSVSSILIRSIIRIIPFEGLSCLSTKSTPPRT